MVTEVGSYLRLIDSCITQLEAQGPSWTCNERKKEEEDDVCALRACPPCFAFRVSRFGVLVSNFGLQVSRFGFRVSSFVFPDSGFGARASGLGCEHLWTLCHRR